MRGVLLVLAVLLAACVAVSAADPAPPLERSVLILKTYPWDQEYMELPIVQRLEQEGWKVVLSTQVDLTPATLRAFPVAIIADLWPGAPKPEALPPLAALFSEYLQGGGTLWVFGRSMNHMTSNWVTDCLNEVLKPWGGQVLQELVRDPQREETQVSLMRFRYAYTSNIVKDSLTAGVKGFWYPNTMMVGATSPLALSPEWKPLLRAMKGATTVRIIPDANGYARDSDQPGTAGEAPIIAAVRAVGKGRLLLTGFTSTVPFYGYQHAVWEDISPTRGFGSKKSDWLTFFLTSLRGLAESATVSGTVTPRPVVWEDPKPQVISDWSKVSFGRPGGKVYRGVLGAATGYSDGSGTVADWAGAAKAAGASFLVFAEDLTRIDGPTYDKLVADCAAVTTADFLALPGLKFLDVGGNHRMLFGPLAYPEPTKLHLPDKSIYSPVFNWFDSGTGLSVIYDYSHNNWPYWASPGYNAMALLTFEQGQVRDDARAAYLRQNQMGDLLTPVVVHLLRAPQELGQITHWWNMPAPDLATLARDLTHEYPHYTGWRQGFVSTGPRVVNWAGANLSRAAGGRYYAPGTERWRLFLEAESDAPLATVEILDGDEVLRVFRPAGKTCQITVDELHDRRKVLMARITDTEGRWALTGGMTAEDPLFRQFLCSDHYNFMSGQQETREETGRFLRMAASSMLDRATWPCVGTPQTADPSLLNPPGVDGGFGNTMGMWTPMYVRGQTWSEYRWPAYQLNFRYCSRDCLIFDLDFNRRFAEDKVPWPDLANPWVYMEPARYVHPRVAMYNFPRLLNSFSPTIAEFSMDFERPVKLSVVSSADMARRLFKTHRLGFHHPDFRFNGMLKGFPEWTVPPTRTWTDTLPGLLLGAGENEPSPGYLDRGTVMTPEGETSTLKAGPDAGKPNAWQGRLEPGSALILHPNLGGSGGYFVLDGEMDARLELGYDWLRLYNGIYGQREFKAGEQYAVRLLLLQGRVAEKDPLADWKWYRDAWGITGKTGYTLQVKRGKLLDNQYLVDLEAQEGGVEASVGQADLGQRLPLRLRGLSEKCTAGIVNNTRREWLPIGVTPREAYATLDTRPGPSEIYVGNLVRCSDADLWCTLLPEGAGWVLEVHNPTTQARSATVTVPGGLWMVGGGSKTVETPAGSTVRVAWGP